MPTGTTPRIPGRGPGIENSLRPPAWCYGSNDEYPTFPAVRSGFGQSLCVIRAAMEANGKFPPGGHRQLTIETTVDL
jgi:hypothetical protein